MSGTTETTTMRHVTVGVLTGLLSALLIAFMWDFFRDDGPKQGQFEAGGKAQLRGTAESITIGGDAKGLIVPGVMVPLNLAIDNPHDFDFTIKKITVTVTAVDAPEADADHPCNTDDFKVGDFSGGGARVLRIDGRTHAQLSELRLARRHWPTVGMINSRVNQDGCKGASLTLAFAASGVEVRR